MGPWLPSFGFVVMGVETSSRTDFDVARGMQVLAALKYLTTQSPVCDRVDRLAVIGHSIGGGVVYMVPTMVIGGQDDTVVSPSYLSALYAIMPASNRSGFLHAGADHPVPGPDPGQPLGFSIYRSKRQHVLLGKGPALVQPMGRDGWNACATGTSSAAGALVEPWTRTSQCNQQ